MTEKIFVRMENIQQKIIHSLKLHFNIAVYVVYIFPCIIISIDYYYFYIGDAKRTPTSQIGTDTQICIFIQCECVEMARQTRKNDFYVRTFPVAVMIIALGQFYFIFNRIDDFYP